MESILYKIIVVGDCNAGKTSLIRRYVHGIFSTHYKLTIGVDFALKTIQYDENTVVKLQLWDIAGQERFGQMSRVYYKEAVGAIIVFDLNCDKSYDNIIKWKEDIDNKVRYFDQPIPVILVANKFDLINDEKWEDLSESLNLLCQKHNFIGYIATSAKDDINVDKVGEILVKYIMLNYNSCNSPKDENIINIDTENTDKNDECGC